MSEVKRWNVESDEQDGPCSLWNVESAQGEFVKYEDYAELKVQRDALAAENAELKELYRQSVKELDDTCFEMGMMRGEKSMEYPAPETRATDAYLNSVRAQSISDALDSCTALCDTDCVMDAHDISYEDAELRSEGAAELRDELAAYAAQLRAGEPS